MATYLDTSVLLLISEGFPLLDELRRNARSDIIILDAILYELGELSKSHGKRGKAAKIAKQYLTQQRLKTVQTKYKYGDAALLNVASSEDTIVTLDKKLMTEAKSDGIRVLRPTKKNKLREE